jgi:hypothetical protein
MNFHTVALFWRDQQACCFTSFRFFDEAAPLERAGIIAAAIEQLSALQLYCVIADYQVLPWTSFRQSPKSGTEKRVEIALYPSEPLNPKAGITTLKITIPGPNKAISGIFTSSDFDHPYWRLLEKEIIPYLRLPNCQRSLESEEF